MGNGGNRDETPLYSEKFDPKLCPRCDSTRITPLVQQNGLGRFQCSKCDHVYAAIVHDGRRVARFPDGKYALDPPESEAELDREVKEAFMVAKLKCPKCGKPYERGGKKFDAHVSACGSTQPAAIQAGGNVAVALEALRARREEILAGVPELKEIDTAIATLEKVNGGSGRPE